MLESKEPIFEVEEPWLSVQRPLAARWLTTPPTPPFDGRWIFSRTTQHGIATLTCGKQFRLEPLSSQLPSVNRVHVFSELAFRGVYLREKFVFDNRDARSVFYFFITENDVNPWANQKCAPRSRKVISLVANRVAWTVFIGRKTFLETGFYFNLWTKSRLITLWNRIIIVWW